MAEQHWMTSPSGSEFLHRLACKGPADVDTVAKEFGVHRNNVRKIFRGAHAAGVVHVARYERRSALARQPVKVWAIGPGQDAERTLYSRQERHSGRWETADSAARILARLTCSDCTVKVLSADCHLTETIVRSQLRQMVKAGVLHLAAYASTAGIGGMPPKIYRLGPGKPARLKAKTKSENYRAWRLRKIERYGRETAMSMLKSRKAGGAETIMREGRIVYRRQPAGGAHG